MKYMVFTTKMMVINEANKLINIYVKMLHLIYKFRAKFFISMTTAKKFLFKVAKKVFK